MSMDDLLTRMIEAQKEADGIVSDAGNEARELLAKVRREVADGEASAKEEDRKAAEAAIAEAVAASEKESARRLKEAAEEQGRRADEFHERLEARKRRVVEGLMGHEWKL